MKNIPNYVLYGENTDEIFPDYLHIESIRSRSIHHGWKFSQHQHHNLHQFFYVRKGGGRVSIDQSDYELNDNQIMSIPALTVHGFQFSPNTDGWVITLPQIYLQNIVNDTGFLIKSISQILIHSEMDEKLVNEFVYIFETIEQAHKGNLPIRNFKLRTYANLLVCKVAELYPFVEEVNQNVPKQKQKIVQNLQTLINSNFKKRQSVADYSKSMGMTPTHLNRICKSVLNISPSQLIDERSVLEAKRLLSYTSMTISEISYELGFFDPAHFSKFFHNRTKQKPSEFRKNILKKA